MIYLDNASTTFIKPQSVYDAMYSTMKKGIGNPGRGANAVSMSAGKIIADCRYELNKLFGGEKSENVILKSSVTEALNTLIIGLMRPGDHVIASVMEHNSVLRPLEKLRRDGVINYDLLPCDENGRVAVEKIPELEKKNTRAVIMSHVSNLTGTIQPIEQVRGLLRNKDIFILADAAQSGGYINVGLDELKLDAVAFTGHKGLLGPQGTGGFVINDRINDQLKPVFTGGTGSDSLSLDQPLYLPDKFEAGTHNLPGIAGLLEGIKYINKISIDIIQKENNEKISYFIRKLTEIRSVSIMGYSSEINRIPNFSLLIRGSDYSEAAFMLEQKFGIITRSGYHCAPLAHKSLGTGSTGSLRVSFGRFTTMEDIDHLIVGLKYFDEVNHGRL